MRYLLLFIALLTCALPATAQQEWSLVWADEFDGEGLPDTSSWRYNVDLRCDVHEWMNA